MDFLNAFSHLDWPLVLHLTWQHITPVSYTHLTLPTILLV